MNEKKFYISAYFYPYDEEDDEVEKSEYALTELENLKKTAVIHNLFILSSISLKYKTYLNQHQVFEAIKKELPLLKNEKVNKNLIESIERIADLVIHEGYQFLKIEPCE